jgi:hypothetical protein
MIKKKRRLSGDAICLFAPCVGAGFGRELRREKCSLNELILDHHFRYPNYLLELVLWLVLSWARLGLIGAGHGLPGPWRRWLGAWWIAAWMRIAWVAWSGTTFRGMRCDSMFVGGTVMGAARVRRNGGMRIGGMRRCCVFVGGAITSVGRVGRNSGTSFWVVRRGSVFAAGAGTSNACFTCNGMTGRSLRRGSGRMFARFWRADAWVAVGLRACRFASAYGNAC